MAHDRFRMFGRCLILAAGLILLAPRGIAEAATDPVSASRVLYSPDGYPQLTLPDGRRETIRSMLAITRQMHFGEFVWDEKSVPLGPVWVRVDLARQLLSVFRGGHEIGTAVILYGTDGKPTPTGSLKVLEKNPHYYSRSYHAPMPFMLRLTNDGVAIHGSSVQEGRATHGCIGVPIDFARLLFGAAKKGDLVAVLPAQEPQADRVK